MHITNVTAGGELLYLYFKYFHVLHLLCCILDAKLLLYNG